MLADIFKAYDIRGKVGTELNAEVAMHVGQAMADWLPNEGIVAVGRDMRPDSEDLAKAVIEGLRMQGRSVWDIGQITTDMIYFAVGKNGLAGGAVVTASHNPGEYNGIKLCREEARPIGLETGLADIRDAVLAQNFVPAAKMGDYEKHHVNDGWIDHVLSFIDVSKLTPLKLAVDAGNGMAGAIFPLLEKHVPWQITRMYFELDGTFPNHEANPLKFETLKDLIETIKRDKLDGGVAFDGDGDRAFLIDETGEIVTAGAMSAMIAEYFLQEHKGGTIVYDARNSRTVPEVVQANGGVPVISRVGHAIIKDHMRKHDASFGGEGSGHFYFKDNWYADSGLIAAVIGLYVATLSGLKLSELRKKYSHYEAIPETNFEVEDKNAAIEKLAALFPEAKQDRLDGLTVSFDDKSWFNVRPSNTESLLRLNAEAATNERLEELKEKVVGAIKS
jgi:phosphomannomutase